MLHAIGHPVAMCCDVLRHLGCCWLKFENGQIFHATFGDVAWYCSRLTRLVQQFCTQACALVRFSIPNMSQHVATRRNRVLNARNMLRPRMLRYVTFKCCDRLAGALGMLKLLYKIFILISGQLKVYLPDLCDDKYRSYQGRATRPC